MPLVLRLRLTMMKTLRIKELPHMLHLMLALKETLEKRYRIAGKFGGLAVWRLKHEPPNLIPPIFCHDVIDVGVWERSRTSSSS